jgi:hypothetical protein
MRYYLAHAAFGRDFLRGLDGILRLGAQPSSPANLLQTIQPTGLGWSSY